MDAALYSILSNHSGLTALVSTRIAPVRLKEGESLPAVTYQRITSQDHWAGGADAGVRSIRYQVSSWGANYDQARAVATQVRAALQRYSGTAAGVVVQGIFITSETDLYDDPPHAYHSAIDIEAHYET